jgi:hypothetical protein
MADDSYSAVRKLVWKTNIPETVLELYFGHVRAFPAWKRNFPQYLHPSIQDVIQLAPDKIKVITDESRYVFAFEERNTLVPEAADFVKTGVLEVFCNGIGVLRLSISPTDSESDEAAGTGWTARCIEEFIEGEWIDELARLASQLSVHEEEQKRREQESSDYETRRRTELQNKLGEARKEAPERYSRLRRLFNR